MMGKMRILLGLTVMFILTACSMPTNVTETQTEDVNRFSLYPPFMWNMAVVGFFDGVKYMGDPYYTVPGEPIVKNFRPPAGYELVRVVHCHESRFGEPDIYDELTWDENYNCTVAEAAEDQVILVYFESYNHPVPEAQVSFSVSQDWGTGYNGFLEVVNTTGHDAWDWKIDLFLPENHSVSSSSYPFQVNNESVTFTSNTSSYIEHGESVKIPISGSYSGIYTAPEVKGTLEYYPPKIQVFFY